MSIFKLGDAVKELTSAVGAKSTAIAGAKLLGKTLVNSVELSVGLLKNVTDEHRQKKDAINRKAAKILVDEEIRDVNSKLKEMRPTHEDRDMLEDKKCRLERERGKL
ncbi:MAG: hypothetical protein J0665_14345 [Deltaproteobacteria bacterium]|nr:hypothetical protein [Deltaproteobacteria bacterium]